MVLNTKKKNESTKKKKKWLPHKNIFWSPPYFALYRLVLLLERPEIVELMDEYPKLKEKT